MYELKFIVFILLTSYKLTIFTEGKMTCRCIPPILNYLQMYIPNLKLYSFQGPTLFKGKYNEKLMFLIMDIFSLGSVQLTILLVAMFLNLTLGNAMSPNGYLDMPPHCILVFILNQSFWELNVKLN